jgi:threonyl-tRNA synthetase
MRWAELGTVYRYERSGVLHGLARVRGFTQDDAHIFCRPDQLQDEITGALEFARFMMQAFGFHEYEIFLSTKPEKYAGTDEIWNEATDRLETALNGLQLPYEVDPGAGVFYGPKIDIKLKDALGRTWQGPTIQVDFNLPERFEVSYIAEDGQEHPVVMIHRTVLGSMERFLACLIEHYAGALPVWLSPVQAQIIPIADRHLDYANKVQGELKRIGLRVQVDDRPERMNTKIRDAQLQKIPYMLVVGDKEESGSTLSVRLRSGENISAQSIEQFKEMAKSAVENKS